MKWRKWILSGLVLFIISYVSAQSANTAGHILVAAQIDRVWEAIVEKEISDDWFPYPMASATFEVGGRVLYGDGDQPAIIADVIAIDPGRSLTLRLDFQVGPEMLVAEPPTRLRFDLTALGPSCALRVVQDEMENSLAAARSSAAIWDANLSKLKTRLETGRRLALSFEDARKIAEEGADQSPQQQYVNPLAYPREITFYVKDLKATRPWFEKAFALPLASFSLDYITFDMARPRIRIAEARPGETEPGQVSVAYYAKDVNALYTRLQKEGVEIKRPLETNRRVQTFAFIGPEGYLFDVQGPAPEPAEEQSEGSDTTP